MAPQEITLRTLVVDYMNDLSSSGIPIEQEFDIKFVGRAVGASRRPINRTAVLANLESILEKEAQAGHFFKSGEGRFVLQAPLLSTYHPHHHPPLPPPPTSSQPSFILSPAP
ncbi:Atherinlike [Caligus rogercresseyi]|uniref:Atherinlike n=1 Tax=Caligus rogercresseyi TaxID=217165 RepID=A0A7T8QV11_CALRO|nr:Atherinlike [Caligus rogercresseyi]